MIWIVIALAVVVLALVVALRRRRTSDGVVSFQRQIDALSPEARRPVVDRMQRLDEPRSTRSGSASGGLVDPGLNQPVDDTPDGEDDGHGS